MAEDLPCTFYASDLWKVKKTGQHNLGTGPNATVCPGELFASMTKEADIVTSWLMAPGLKIKNTLQNKHHDVGSSASTEMPSVYCDCSPSRSRRCPSPLSPK